MRKYIARQIIGLFFVSLFGLVVFTALTLAVQLSDLILTKSETFLVVFKLLALKVPDFLGFALPIALVVSTFIVLARLMNNQEILAFQLGGYSLKRISYPIILIGLLVSLAGFGINNYLVPWSNLEYRREVYRIARNSPLPSIQSDLFFRDPEGRMIYVGQYVEEADEVRDVLIFNSSGLDLPGLETSGNYPELLTAKTGRLTEEGWLLSGGRLIGLDATGQISYSMQFEELNFEIRDEIENLVFSGEKTDEMGIGELLDNARTAARAGRAETKLRYAFHSRLSRPLSALVFVLFSVPLSLLLRHQSKAVGILLALLSVGGYQGVLLWGQSTVRQNALQPYLGAWLPNMIFGGVGLVLFLLLDRTGLSFLRTRLGSKMNLFNRR